MKFDFNFAKYDSAILHSDREQDFFAGDKKLDATRGKSQISSWSELRDIGSQDVYRKLTDARYYKAHTEGLQENQDWEYYIGQFNKQYKRQLRDEERKKELEDHSISTLAETMSELIKNRNRRLVMYRKSFIFTNILLLSFFFYLLDNWYRLYLIYPVGFLRIEDDGSVFSAKYFTPEYQFIALACYLHVLIVVFLGLLCALCHQENPQYLKQYILRIPFLLIIPLGGIFAGVKFNGVFSKELLSLTMDLILTKYHDNRNELLKNDSQKQWDQAHRLLFCCGVFGPTDWQSVDDDLVDESSTLPESCCPKKFYRDKMYTAGNRPPKDDCYYKINPLLRTNEYEFAYPDGCLDKAHEFFIKQGAILVALMFVDLLLVGVNLVLGKQYYTTGMKIRKVKFKYHFRDWFKDIFFISLVEHWICNVLCKDCHVCRVWHHDKEKLRQERHHQSQALATSTGRKSLKVTTIADYPSRDLLLTETETDGNVSNVVTGTSSQSLSIVPETTEGDELNEIGEEDRESEGSIASDASETASEGSDASLNSLQSRRKKRAKNKRRHLH